MAERVPVLGIRATAAEEEVTMSITPEEQARRARYLTGLMWHVGAFLIINTFFWVLDLIVGQAGVQWAYWITLFWGFALAFHVLAYLVVGRRDGMARTHHVTH